MSASTLIVVTKHIKNEGHLADLTEKGKDAVQFMNHINTIAGKIPGSQSSKLYVWNSIHCYFSYFGLLHIYLTLNPSTTDNPVFQFTYGDKTVDLSKTYLLLCSKTHCALIVIEDPVIVANFFEFIIICFFTHLMGWDYNLQKSTPTGGIIGHLKAFYGTAEYTEWGNPHMHFLLWLIGGLNPSDIHLKLKQNPSYQRQYLIIGNP